MSLTIWQGRGPSVFESGKWMLMLLMRAGFGLGRGGPRYWTVFDEWGVIPGMINGSREKRMIGPNAVSLEGTHF